MRSRARWDHPADDITVAVPAPLFAGATAPPTPIRLGQPTRQRTDCRVWPVLCHATHQEAGDAARDRLSRTSVPVSVTCASNPRKIAGARSTAWGKRGVYSNTAHA